MISKIYIYLKGEEELGEIIEKIRSVKEKEIILVVPQNTKALLHSVNLEILKKELDNIDKKVYFNTDDEKLINLARYHKISLFLTESLEKPIIDIHPPKAKKEEFRRITSPKFQTKLKIKFNFWNFLIYLTSFIFILGIVFLFWYIFQTRADIYIDTEKLPVELTEVITLKESVLQPDYENKTLPGKFVIESAFKTETVSTTGKVFIEEKPYLKVIFVNYLDKEIPIKIGTRLLFRDNIFRTTEKIILPPAKDQNPGQIEVEALLDTLKDENLKIPKDTNLRIIKLENIKMEDGRYWTDVIKAKVAEDYDINVYKSTASVTSQDITNVQLSLDNSLKSIIKANLSLKYPDSFYYFDPSLVKIEIQNISHQIGDKSNQISAVGKATYETIITSKKEFDDFVKNLINKKILNEKQNLIIKDFKYEKIDLIDIDSRNKAMILGISAKAVLIPDLTPEALKDKIKGKSLTWVQDYFSQFEGVTKVRIKIFPQWKENLPNDLKRIKIVIQ